MKEFFTRMAYKLSGFKSLFTMAVLAILVMHDMSPENADVLSVLIITVLGAKAVQYGTEAIKSIKNQRPPDAED